MNASAHFLNYGGRLQFVKSVLLSLPIFYLCSLKVQKMVLNICDRSSRHCLWAKEEESSSTNSLSAWSEQRNMEGRGCLTWNCKIKHYF
jgi:hypothetical protein